MAARKRAILIAGQSNAINVGDAKRWEDLHPQAAIRSPLYPDSYVTRFPQGSMSDDFVLPGVFAGGPQSGQNGDGPQAGTWQLSNGRGMTLPAMRYLTFFRPASVGLNLATTEHTKFPGTGSIAAGSTSAKLLTSVRWQTARTGIVTAASDVANTLTIGAGIKLISGERIFLVVTGTGVLPAELKPPTLPATTPLYVINIVGNTFQVSLNGLTPIDFSAGFVAGGAGDVKAYPVNVARITRRATGLSYTGYTDAPTPNLNINLDVPMLPPPEANEEFTYEVVADSAPPNPNVVVLQNQYGGLADTGTAFYGPKIVKIRQNGSLAGKITSPHFPVYQGQPVQFTEENLPITLPTGLLPNTTYYVSRREVPGRTVVVGSTNIITNAFGVAPEHQLVDGERLRLVGTSFPTPTTGPALDGTTIYYAVRIDAFNVGISRGELGPPIDFTAPGAVIALLSVDSYTSFFVSATPGGPEIVFGSTSGALVSKIQVLVSFRGSLSGMQIRCTSGTVANVGVARGLSDVIFNASDGTHHVKLAATFPSPTAAGDKFVIEVPALATGEAVPFEKWALWLPYSPFEGSTRAGVLNGATMSAAPGNSFLQGIGAAAGSETKFYVQEPTSGFPVSFSTSDGILVLGFVHNCAVGDRLIFRDFGAIPAPFAANTSYYVLSTPDAVSVTLGSAPGGSVMIPAAGPLGFGVIVQSTPSLPVELWSGRPLFSIEAGGTSFYFALTYDGVKFATGETLNRAGLVHITDHENKRNPHPPGFNYASPSTLPTGFQPFDGMQISGPSVSIAETIALLHHNHYGEEIYVMHAGFGGSTIGNREIVPGPATTAGYGWYDPAQLYSWSVGDPSGCFAQFLKELDAMVLANKAANIEIDITDIYWLQGESDASYLEFAERYAPNLRELKRRMRQAIKDRNLCAGSANSIRFIQPTILSSTVAQQFELVNAAIVEVADEDPFSEWVDATDTERQPDGLHYTGKGMTTLGRSCFDASVSLDLEEGATELGICQMALAHMGQGADVETISSINPSDGSTAANLCAKFFYEIRDRLLEEHEWTWATRRKALVLIPAPTSPREVERPEWAFAYERPADCAGMTAVWPQGNFEDRQSDPYKEERNSKGRQVIYTNTEDAIGVYNAKSYDPARWTAQFRGCLSLELGAVLCGALVQGDRGVALKQRLRMEARAMLPKAKARDAGQSKTNPRDQRAPWDRRGNAAFNAFRGPSRPAP